MQRQLKQMPLQTVTAVIKSHTGAFSREMLLLRSPALERENENSVGAWPLPPNPTVPSGRQSPLSPPSRCLLSVQLLRQGSLPGAGPVLGGAEQQTGRGSGAHSWLGSFVGHGRKLVPDAAQPIQHSVQSFLTQLHSDS